MPDLKDITNIQHILTSDGSSTLFSPVFNQHYHSIHGAIQESMHVFIQAGLHALPDSSDQFRIFEMGFGTGLNALLTHLHRGQRQIHYLGVEAYPIESEHVLQLNYPSQLEIPEVAPIFQQLHQSPWGEPVDIEPGFICEKHHTTLDKFLFSDKIDLIYYDAFAPTSQPELWTEEVMAQMAAILSPGGIFVTYSAKSSVRRGLQDAGLIVEKIPGPPGKREMIRARKELE